MAIKQPASSQDGAADELTGETDDQPALSPEEPVIAKPYAWLTTAVNLALGLALVLLVIVAAQLLVLYNQIALLPFWIRPVGYGLLVFVSLVFFYFGVRFAFSYLRLRTSPRLQLNLEVRQDERRRVHDELEGAQLPAARHTLSGFLNAYNLRPGQSAHLSRLGLDRSRLELLRAGLNSAEGDDAEWLQRFQKEFLEELDEAAWRRIRLHARNVMVTTAMSPRGAIDTLIVLSAAYKVVSDLCGIYNLRAGRWETSLILLHVIANLAAASQLDETTDSAGEGFADWLAGSAGFGSAIGVGTVRQLAGPFMDGVLNAYLLWRLGSRTQDYLRPVRKDKSGLGRSFFAWVRSAGGLRGLRSPFRRRGDGV